MKQTLLSALAAGALMVGGIAATSQIALADDDGRKYKVSIANATGGQPLAPGLIITHKKKFSLFQINDKASDGLTKMAETGNPGLLKEEVMETSGVKTAKILESDGPGAPAAIPGETNSTYITTSGKYLTAVGMLAATNDAFYAVRGIKLPKKGKISVYAIAYDAGTEMNNEEQKDIATGGDNSVRLLGGEEFIHVHRGIHGDAFLDRATYDWRNPVVKITIERVRGHDDDDD